MSKAYRSRKRIIIGGDFNTQFDVGIRGVALRQFAEEFGLCITNTTDSETSTNWTFESSMGVRRRLDFILASRLLLVIESGPSDKLDLGSDHRAVQSTLGDTKKGTQVQHRKKVPAKGWYPEIDVDGNALKYCDSLHAPLQRNEVLPMGELEKIIHDAATGPDIRAQAKLRPKPWHSQEIQDLIQRRRMCSTSKDRASISKLIQKTSRRFLRKYQNEEASNILEKFCDLSDLPKIPEFPIVSSRENIEEIDCNKFAKAS